MPPFQIGVNYWPVHKGMHWWKQFDSGEIAEDFARLAGIHLSPVRIFLLWEDFQPNPICVNLRALDRLADAADIAADVGLGLWITFFTGHMSGANWFPDWMINRTEADRVKFPIASESASFRYLPKNPYRDPDIIKAQKIMVGEVAALLYNHPALWGWDLGNEPSNCYQPDNKEQARAWLREMVEGIRKYDQNCPITLGLHQEDLEENRGMDPADVAESCDLITMHAYPAYSGWARSKTDSFFPLYLAELTRWLSAGKKVWISEFGMSTGTDPFSIDEPSAARYAMEVLERLRTNGIPGALWWCYGDYASQLWELPPFNDKIHERSFGIFRKDDTSKEIVSVLKNADRTGIETGGDLDWIDIESHEYWRNPGRQIRRLYSRFLEARES